MEALLDTVSIARLHGEACWRCGAVYRPLKPAGSVTIYGRQWQVVVCGDHREMTP